MRGVIGRVMCGIMCGGMCGGIFGVNHGCSLLSGRLRIHQGVNE